MSKKETEGGAPGYVYILTNPGFREDWVKIGKSARPVDVRSRELDNTAVPLPFEIFATMRTRKYHEVEKVVHKTIDRLTDYRIRQGREFFNVPPQMALDIFKDLAHLLDDAVITRYEGDRPIEVKLDDDSNSTATTPRRQARVVRRGRFQFSMAGIKIGEMVRFDPTGVMVKVASDNQVEHENNLYKLSRFAATFMPKRNKSGAYQGALFFSYNGKTLEQLRKERERNQE